MVPARVESVAKFRERAPHGMVLVPSDRELRAYGYNPYAGIESENNPGTIRDEGSALPAPFERVVSIGDEAWTLRHIRNQGKVFFKDLVTPGSRGKNPLWTTNASPTTAMSVTFSSSAVRRTGLKRPLRL